MLKINGIKKESLKGKDLDEIAVQSLRCGMTMAELMILLKNLRVRYTWKHLEKIRNYREYIKRTTASHALGF